MSKLVAVALFAALLLPAAALAHSDPNGPHGGEVQDATPGPIHIETVVEGNTLSVYLTDADGNPLRADTAQGQATVLAHKVKQQVTLLPSGKDVLKGSGDFVPEPTMRVLVVLTLDGQKQQALFSPVKE
jgi:hypothetical protein